MSHYSEERAEYARKHYSTVNNQQIKVGDHVFDNKGNYFGVVQKGLEFRGDFVFLAIAPPMPPFRDAYSGTERAEPITVDRIKVVPTPIPGVWMVEHRLDLGQRREFERLEFALYDTFNLMG